MRARDWLLGGVAATTAAALALPATVNAEPRRFTSEPLDVNRSYLIVYAPVFMARLGSAPDSDVPGIAAQWAAVPLESEGLSPSSGSGEYRIRAITVKRDPARPTEPPEIDILIEQEGRLPEGAPPPQIVLTDPVTKLETRALADVFREAEYTLYRVELHPPKAALVPPGHRIYLNPADRYEVQILAGAALRVAGSRETLPTFGGENPREQSTRRRRRR